MALHPETLPTNNESETERPGIDCGVFGMYVPPALATEKMGEIAFAGLMEGQHRGQESAGIVVANGEQVFPAFKRMGLIKDVYQEYKRSSIHDSGYIGVGHNRYSTTGSSREMNAGPFTVESDLGTIGVSHNGNITNAVELKGRLLQAGIHFQSTTDSEVIAALIAHTSGETWPTKMIGALNQLEGSFSLVMCTKDSLFAARDRHGNRPLSVGYFEKDGQPGYAIASETPTFFQLGIPTVFDVQPGELLSITEGKLHHQLFTENIHEAFCGLEIAYLMRPDARLEGVQLHTLRRHLGAVLEQRFPAPATVDFVTFIPESSKSASSGFAESISKRYGRYIPNERSMIKGRYGTLNGGVRGFIQATDTERKEVASGYFPLDGLEGKEIVLVDDSIVRGFTTEGVIEIIQHYVGKLRNGGVSKIHLRIVFPEIKFPCPLGIDISVTDRLLARDEPFMAEYLGVDSLGMLNPDEFTQAVQETVERDMGLCMGCVTGQYPVEIFNADKMQLEKTNP